MTSAPQSAPVASLERRFYAFALDRLIGWSLVGAAGFGAWWWFFRDDKVLPGVLVVVGALLLVGLVFAVLLGVRGTSPGKSAFGLRVVNPETGTPIGVGRALLRTLILGAATLPLFGLGAATLAWTAVEDRSRERRGWHDHKARSIVVDVRPVQAAAAVAEDERPRHVVNLTAMRLMPVRQPGPAAAPVLPAPARTTPPAPTGREMAPPVPPAASDDRWRPDPASPARPTDAPGRPQAPGGPGSPPAAPPVGPPPAQPQPAPSASAPPRPAPPEQSPPHPGPPHPGPPHPGQPQPGEPPTGQRAARPLTPSPPPAEFPRNGGTSTPGPTEVGPPPSAGRSEPVGRRRKHVGDGETGGGAAGTPAPRRTTWRVTFDSGESFVVEGLGLVGRRPEGRSGEPVRHAVPLVSQNMSISKTHAQFHLAGDGALVVMDRGSTNGSILIRRGVSRELSAGRPATLLDGDRVLFGDREMRVSKEPT